MKPLRQLVLLFTVGSLSLAAADQPNATLPSPLTLETAVKYALAHYPQIRAALERRAAANGGIALARTAYFPIANALWQSNRATRNNIFGLLLPQQVIPSLTGPVLPTTSNQSVWGSAAGMLVSWEPVDFGYRRASVDAARAGARVASAEVEITQIDIATATAATFISVIDAQQTKEFSPEVPHTTTHDTSRPTATIDDKTPYVALLEKENIFLRVVVH